MTTTDSVAGVDYRPFATKFGSLRKRIPPVEKELIQKNIELKDESRKYKFQAEVDNLTQLARGEELVKFLEGKIGPEGQGIILFIDIDHFKDVNTKHGHPVGNMALRILGKRLKSNFPESKGDFVCRVGGEEFIVVLENQSINIENAFRRAEDFRKLMEQNSIKITKADIAKEEDVGIPEDIMLKKTVSIGVAKRKPGQSYGDWIKAADEAMFDAKNTGRNKVVIAKENINA